VADLQSVATTRDEYYGALVEKSLVRTYAHTYTCITNKVGYGAVLAHISYRISHWGTVSISCRMSERVSRERREQIKQIGTLGALTALLPLIASRFKDLDSDSICHSEK
jgi:hypothetical protein